jgi:hypothetical protein
MLLWCLDNRAQWDAAADCLALRISPNWALELANASRRAKAPALSTVTGQFNPS